MMRVLGFAVLLSALACSQGRPDLLGDAAPATWPRCPEGQLPSRRNCVPAEGLPPCQLVAAQGGCPAGRTCDPGTGCQLGAACGGTRCQPGESCRDGRCRCQAGPCASGQVCGATRDALGEIAARCVAPTFDGDDDGHAVGDLNGDGEPDDCDDLDPTVAPGAQETCDGKDNNCDGTTDEGFDQDQDGYASCANPFWPADCADDEPGVNPGAVDLCQLDQAGQLIDTECSPETDSCPPNSQCCPGHDGCVALDRDPHHCGACGQSCPDGGPCLAGACGRSETTAEVAVADEPVVLAGGTGPSAHPALAWNWEQRSRWLGWWDGSREQWAQYRYWEISYGLAWVHRGSTGGRLLFARRHFVSAPLPHPGDITEEVEALLTAAKEPPWSAPTEVTALAGQDSRPSLAATEDLGYALVWSDGREYQQVHLTLVGADGVADGWSSQVTTETAHHHVARVASSRFFDQDGAVLGVVYQRDEVTAAEGEAGDQQVYFQPVRGTSARQPRAGAPVQVSHQDRGGLTPDIQWTPLGFALVWVDARDGNLFFALLSESGVVLVYAQQVTFGGRVLPAPPSLAWHDGAQRFGVAYQGISPRTGEGKAYFVDLDAYGSPRGAPVALTAGAALQRRPALAATEQGYGVAWEDHQTGRAEIHWAQLSLDGTVAQGPLVLSQHGGEGQGTNPALTYAWLQDDHEGAVHSLAGWQNGLLVGTGEFAVAWEDQAAAALDSGVAFARLNRQ